MSENWLAFATCAYQGGCEIAGAGAVLTGLIFVGLELNQNTEAVQAATLQSIADASQEYLLLMAADPELNRIWRLANDDPDASNDSAASRLFSC